MLEDKKQTEVRLPRRKRKKMRGTAGQRFKLTCVKRSKGNYYEDLNGNMRKYLVYSHLSNYKANITYE